jgi:hypothetical protein
LHKRLQAKRLFFKDFLLCNFETFATVQKNIANVCKKIESTHTLRSKRLLRAAIGGVQQS